MRTLLGPLACTHKISSRVPHLDPTLLAATFGTDAVPAALSSASTACKDVWGRAPSAWEAGAQRAMAMAHVKEQLLYSAIHCAAVSSNFAPLRGEITYEQACRRLCSATCLLT